MSTNQPAPFDYDTPDTVRAAEHGHPAITAGGLSRRHVLPWLMVCALALATTAQAEVFRGVDVPAGEAAFADQVLRYDPLESGGPAPTSSAATDPQNALGAPDFPFNGNAGDPGSVSLGRGGLLEVLFVDNYLTNSGNNGVRDLHVFEVGPDVEATFLAVRPTSETLQLLDPAGDADGDGFFEIGRIVDEVSSIDLDEVFPGFAAGELLFDAVQLIDDFNEGNATGSTVGADIDAVGAVSSAERTIDDSVCVRSPSVACLLDDRFEVKVTMWNFQGQPFTGFIQTYGGVSSETDQSVSFYSFQEGNVELFVKMVDGCGFTGDPQQDAFWLFAAGATNAETEVSVRDTESGETMRIYNPEPRVFVTVANTGAFRTCS